MDKTDTEPSDMFVCRRCGECCRVEGFLSDGITDAEWKIIIPYIEEHYPNGITIRNNWIGFEWFGKIKSLDDIIRAKKNADDPLHRALQIGFCPFLKKENDKKMYCEIYEIRPRACREYRCMLFGR